MRETRATVDPEYTDPHPLPLVFQEQRMAFRRLSDDFAVASQLTEADIDEARALGFRWILSNRPDGEEPGQLTAAEVGALAQKHGLRFVHLPILPGAVTAVDGEKMKIFVTEAQGPVLAFCRSGARSEALWRLAHAASGTGKRSASRIAGFSGSSLQNAGKLAQARVTGKSYDVVIVGGGSAGIAAAASLLRRNRRLSIAIVEPAEYHYYQPGWTFVGAGIFKPTQTRRSQASVIPERVDWLQVAATGFVPHNNQVELADGQVLTYRVLVAAPGIALAWDAIPGLNETLGSNGVTSNYRYDLAPYTDHLVQTLRRGRAIFTQPPIPIKCAGAPQKAMYLSCDHWRRSGILENMDVEFHNAGGALFGVADYVPALMVYVERYGIRLKFGSRLISVDGPRRTATFERTTLDGRSGRFERDFDMLHVVPPQIAPAFIAASPLAGKTGFIEVDPATLQHSRYPNIYALGDVIATSNAKTVAAARKQAPIVAVNVLATLEGLTPTAVYDGYGACPLTVERGKIVLAEFGYEGKLLPSFPAWMVDGTKPSRAAWHLKARILPALYWRGMLKGREWLAHPSSSGPKG